MDPIKYPLDDTNIHNYIIDVNLNTFKFNNLPSSYITLSCNVQIYLIILEVHQYTHSKHNPPKITEEKYQHQISF